MYPALDNYLGKTYLAFPVSEHVQPAAEMIFRVTYVQLLPYLNGRVEYDFNSSYGYLTNQPLDSLSVDIQISGNRTISNVLLPGFTTVNIDIDGPTASVDLMATPSIWTAISNSAIVWPWKTWGPAPSAPLSTINTCLTTSATAFS
jgi:hypothetical protein